MIENRIFPNRHQEMQTRIFFIMKSERVRTQRPDGFPVKDLLKIQWILTQLKYDFVNPTKSQESTSKY